MTHFSGFLPNSVRYLNPSLWQVSLSQPFNSLYPAIPLESYFRDVDSLGELSSCRPFNSPFFDKLVSCRPFNSIPLASYFCAIHPLGDLFACRLFNSPFAHPFGELILYRPSLWRVNFVLSIPWASYFCAVHPLGTLCSCQLYLTLHPSINMASYFYQLFKSPSYIYWYGN